MFETLPDGVTGSTGEFESLSPRSNRGRAAKLFV